MKSKRFHSESGLVLVFALLAVILTAAIASSLVAVTFTETRAVTAASEDARAFYLAESGLQTARWELAEDEDPTGDGEGNVSVSATSGSYAVTATDIGGGFFRLDATASYGQNDVVLEEVVEVTTTSSFPAGALSIVGAKSIPQVQFGAGTDLLIDGGNSPGLVCSPESYDDFGQHFGSGVNSGYIAETDIVGSVTNLFQPGDVELSIAEIPADASSLEITSDLFSDFRDEIDSVWLPSATNKTIPGSGNATWGTSASPIKYKFPVGEKIKSGQTISGYGTLLFPRNFVIEAGGTLDWNGNVIIYDDANNDSFLTVGGALNVTGNVVVVAGFNRGVKFEETALGDVTVNGALTILTDYSKGSIDVEFYVESDFTIDGLVTIVASKHQIEFKPGSDVYVKGSFQLAHLLDVQQMNNMKFKFEDEAEFYKDDTSIISGANALVSLGIDFGQTILSNSLTSSDVATKSWRELPSN